MRENVIDMASTGERTLKLLSLLQRHHHWSGPDLAERLEVSERTLRRDVERLRALGYPVEATRGVDGGYRLAAGASLPPLVLDDEEAVALVVGLQAAAHSGIAGVADASVRALAKAVQVLPAPLRRRAEDLGAATDAATWRDDESEVDPTALTALAQAARSTERVELDYVDATGQGTHRLVEPHRLVVLGRRWYLVAWDLTRHDWRTLRVDRIARPRPTGKRYPPREVPGGDPAAYVRRAVAGQERPTHHVVAIVHAPADGVRRGIGRWGQIEAVDETTCRVVMHADNLAWPLMALGSVGAELELEGPPALVEAMADWAARFGRATAGA